MTRRSRPRHPDPESGSGLRRQRPLSTHPRSARAPVRATSRAVWPAVALVGLVLFLTIDDRYPGAIADGRQMSWTAVAIAETGEIGQARGRDFTWPRAQGDSVSRYGMGMSLAQVPAAWLAPRIESALGSGASQPLFLIVPLLCVCVSAAAAGWIAALLGLGTPGIAAAVLLTAIGSPLGSYAALDLSEPLQAATLSLAFACGLASTQPDTRTRRALLYAGLAGLAAGSAVLTKSSLAVVVPFALLPVLAPGAQSPIRQRFALTLVGLAVPVGAWAWFELARFGQLFASYTGEGFTHPVIDGAWRLLVGPNRGLVLYFPAVALAIAVAVRPGPEASARRRVAALASLGVFAALLVLAASWWAWHGLWGWGPRLLVPAIPVLAAAAAIILDRWGRPARIAFVAASVILNLPGLLQNAAPVTVFTASCEWPLANARVAESLAAYARRESPTGTRVAPDQVLETVALASPFVVYPWFTAATWTRDTGRAAASLGSPPWLGVRPDIACPPPSPAFVSRLIRRPGWPAWGRGLRPDPRAPGVPGVYREGLLDQVVRAQQLGRGPQALALARKLLAISPDGEADALLLESLRLLGRRAEAAEHLSSLPPYRRAEPTINVVLALFERDQGNEQMARALLDSVISSFQGSAAHEALRAPISAWPRDLHDMTATATDQAGR